MPQSFRSSSADDDRPQSTIVAYPRGEVRMSDLAPGPLAELLCAEQTRCWIVGERVAVEAYLRQYPTLRTSGEAVLELIHNEIRLRRQSNESPSLQEYLERFPDHEAALCRQPVLSVTGLLPLTVPSSLPSQSAAALESSAEQPVALPERVSIPGYEILGELGRGGMGVVYKARHLKLGRLVALKMILHARHASAEEHERFRIEAETGARLQHPNVVQIHEVGEHEGLPFVSLEFCSGGSVAAQLNGMPQPPRRAAELIEILAGAVYAVYTILAGAVYAVHEAGVIHRDLKPANVLLAADGTPKITDFSLAKRLGEQGQTATGSIMGTPSYVVPEQTAGKTHDVGPRADVHALGAILYELLTGRPPFRGVRRWGVAG
jgi:serine/threonine protein kinase